MGSVGESPTSPSPENNPGLISRNSWSVSASTVDTSLPEDCMNGTNSDDYTSMVLRATSTN